MNTDPTTWSNEQKVRFLAERAMGWRVEESSDWWYEGDIGIIEIGMWNPIEDANDRDMLVEAMRKNGWDYRLMSHIGLGKYLHRSSFFGHTKIHESAIADTPGTAVCNAAIKALLAEIATDHAAETIAEDDNA